MPEYSDYQRKVIQRYYDHRDTIALTRLQELVSELYLAESDKKRDQVWKRVDKAMKNLKVGEKLRQHILASRDAKVLAANVQDWLKQASSKR